MNLLTVGKNPRIALTPGPSPNTGRGVAVGCLTLAGSPSPSIDTAGEIHNRLPTCTGSIMVTATTKEVVMSFRISAIPAIPEETARIAHQAFPKGSIVMSLRDQLGSLYEDQHFQALFPSTQGQPAWSAWRLALITVMQYIEDMSDIQAAQAVRGRIDWKYALSLALSDPGIDASVLSEFRNRLICAGKEAVLLERLLEECQHRGWLGSGGKQRSDSTHVVAAIRRLHRLEVIGETLRAALNSLAVAVPEWLQVTVPVEWFERYGSRIEDYRFPKSAKARKQLAQTMGDDGHHLLSAVYDKGPVWLIELPAVQVLRRVWIQQFYVNADQEVQLRSTQDTPPASTLILSPYDIEARFGTKRQTQWVGYKVHLSETCDAHAPHLITHVETTPATTNDVAVTESIHQRLASRGLLPQSHLVDAGYISSEHLIESQTKYGLDLVGPVPMDNSWQAQAQHGFDASQFEIDWRNQQAWCPAGVCSQSWTPSRDRHGNETITVGFAYASCRDCPHKVLCTRAQKHGRTVTLRPQAQYMALQKARQAQQTQSFKKTYNQRAGIEGTLAQGIQAFGLRRCRYIGLAKNCLQHLITATAMNIVRLVNWWEGTPFAKTRCSRFAALAPTG